ncbi:MAG: hypothetical protein ABL984_03845 [Pyrinomonadaceae bacterium]
MKSLLLLLIVVSLVSGLVAQAPSAGTLSEEFQLGSRSVKVPAPDGFMGAFTRFDKIAERMIATEDAGNEVLTVHLPASEFPKFEANQDQDLDLYTKVSVSKRVKTLDISPSMFADVVSASEKQIVALLGPNSDIFKRVEGNTGKGLTELWGNETTVRINEPKYLGFFEKGTDTLSFMMSMNFDINNRKFSILNTTSFVRANNRVLFIYTYKRNPIAGDIEKLRSLASKWTKEIRDANKTPSQK